MARILLADDHEILLRGLEDTLGGHPSFEVVAAVTNADEVLPAYQKLKPDIVLLDYRMPGSDADEVIESVVRADPSARIVIFSSFDWEEDIWRAVIAGAVGYIPKTSRLEEVYRALESVAAGKNFFPPEILDKIRAREKRDELTQREQEILQLLAHGLCNKWIADHLKVSESTVKTHISRLLEKLDAYDRTHAVVKAARRGMVHLDAKKAEVDE